MPTCTTSTQDLLWHSQIRMGKRILFLVLSDGVELASATSGETKLGNTVASQGGGSNCKLLELQETGDPNPTWRAHTLIIVLFCAFSLALRSLLVRPRGCLATPIVGRMETLANLSKLDARQLCYSCFLFIYDQKKYNTSCCPATWSLKIQTKAMHFLFEGALGFLKAIDCDISWR